MLIHSRHTLTLLCSPKCGCYVCKCSKLSDEFTLKMSPLTNADVNKSTYNFASAPSAKRCICGKWGEKCSCAIYPLYNESKDDMLSKRAALAQEINSKA